MLSTDTDETNWKEKSSMMSVVANLNLDLHAVEIGQASGPGERATNKSSNVKLLKPLANDVDLLAEGDEDTTSSKEQKTFVVNHVLPKDCRDAPNFVRLLLDE